jgi:hypothetical protein
MLAESTKPVGVSPFETAGMKNATRTETSFRRYVPFLFLERRVNGL